MDNTFNPTREDFKIALVKLSKLKKNIPIKVKVNRHWLMHNVAIGEIVMVANDIKIPLFMGIPVEISNDVEAYEFVYEDEE